MNHAPAITPEETAVLKPPRRGEIFSLTSIRGVLALWVVLYHYWNDVVKLFPSAEAVSPFIRCGNVAVPAFFVLSGFVLAYNYADRMKQWNGRATLRFLALRLARVYPVHLATLLLLSAMVWVSHRRGLAMTESGYTVRDFVLNVFLVHTWVPNFELNWNYPSWSISSEWFAYLMFPFMVAAIGKWITRGRAIGIGLVLLAASLLMMAPPFPIPFSQLLLVVPTFLTGLMIYWSMPPASADRAGLRWLTEFAMLSLPVLCFVMPAGVLFPALLLACVIAIASLAYEGERCHRAWKSKPAVYLGDVSYSLYMTHTLAARIVYKVIPSERFEHSPAIVKLAVLAAYAVNVIVFCVVCYYVVEKPNREFFRKKLGKKPVVAPGTA